MYRLLLSFIATLVLGVGLIGPTSTVQATCNNPDDPLGLDCGAASGLNPTDPRLVVGRIINVALGLLGMISVALVVYAGFLWMTGGGNSEQVEKARKILTAAVIGLLIILSAFSISNYVLENLYVATQGEVYGGQQ